MYVIRPIALQDLEEYIHFAFNVSLGMVSMPKNREILQKNLNLSLQAFSKELTQPEQEFYLLVIENEETGDLGGISGIESKTGIIEPNYYYRIETKTVEPYEHLPLPKTIATLRPVTVSNGPTEICSLYLAPEFRKEGLGRLLSLSRFLFMACFPERFDTTVFALMRGYLDKTDSNPFWDSLGCHFLNVQFAELLRFQEGSRAFVPHIIPEFPVYVNLLSKEAQESIGKVHNNTKPALNMLQQEGFTNSNEIDIFDAGPKIVAELQSVRTFKESKVAIVKEVILNGMESPEYIICNIDLNFRACVTHLTMDEEGKVILPSETAEALLVKPGDKVRYVTTKKFV